MNDMPEGLTERERKLWITAKNLDALKTVSHGTWLDVWSALRTIAALRAEVEKAARRGQDAVRSGVWVVDGEVQAVLVGKLAQAEAEVKRLKAKLAKVTATDKPWNLRECLEKLIEASEILLDGCNYDGHGYELVIAAAQAARRHHAALAELEAGDE